MRPLGRRTVALAVAVAGLLVAFVTPAAAQSVSRQLFDGLNTQLLYVALPLTVFVEIILVYAVIKFRNNDDPEPTAEDPALEVTWTAATAVILLFVFVAAFTVLGSPYMSTTSAAASPTTLEPGDVPDGAIEVDVLAYRYGWEVRYEGANLTTQGELVVPANRDVYLNLTSADVIHSLFVPRWGIKQDVFPGRQTYVRTRVTEPGTVRLYCAELCGVGHSRMTGNATALSPERFASWLAEHEGERNVREVPAVNETTT